MPTQAIHLSMSFTKGDRPDISYEEITDLVLNLPVRKQSELAERMRRAKVKADWEAIFKAFKCGSLDDRTINETVKKVRAKRHGTKTRATGKDRR